MSWPLTSFQRNRFHRSSACSTLLLVTLCFEFHCNILCRSAVKYYYTASMLKIAIHCHFGIFPCTNVYCRKLHNEYLRLVDFVHLGALQQNVLSIDLRHDHIRHILLHCSLLGPISQDKLLKRTATIQNSKHVA